MHVYVCVHASVCVCAHAYSCICICASLCVLKSTFIGCIHRFADVISYVAKCLCLYLQCLCLCGHALVHVYVRMRASMCVVCVRGGSDHTFHYE